MRLVITENSSLDGVVEQNEQTGEWFSVAANDANTSDINEHFGDDEPGRGVLAAAMFGHGLAGVGVDGSAGLGG